ncbi:hypothetical protein [Streptomyces sp. NPDC056512]
MGNRWSAQAGSLLVTLSLPYLPDFYKRPGYQSVTQATVPGADA